jgi:hypothetical protein
MHGCIENGRIVSINSNIKREKPTNKRTKNDPLWLFFVVVLKNHKIEMLFYFHAQRYQFGIISYM